MPKKRILVIDDQEEVLSLLKDSLWAYDFDVKVSKEPRDALSLVKSFKPDLILLDLFMPDIGGFEICEILNDHPEIRGIPIIIISGLDDLVDVKKAYKLGVIDYLVKPFSMADLIKKVTKAIANKEKPL